MVPFYICEGQRLYQEMLAERIGQYYLIKAFGFQINSIAKRPQETFDRPKGNP